MFWIEDNSKFIDHVWSDDQLYIEDDYPTELKFIDSILPPHSNVGAKSGAFLLASYYEALKFKSSNPSKLDDDYIIENIYDKVSIKSQTGHICLSDGMNRINDMMNSSYSIPKYNVYYILYHSSIKRFIHKNSLAIIELKANSAYCSQDFSSFVGKYLIENNGTILDQNLSKGFICVGYDDYGIILFNNLGNSFGNYGFIKLKWNVVQANFIKGSAISII